MQIVDDRILTFDPDEKDRSRAFMERGFMPPGTKRYKDRRFMFDKVFGHEARQDDVYSATSQPLLAGLFEGYNATVFAYGVSHWTQDFATLQVLRYRRRLQGVVKHTLSVAQNPIQESST